MRLFIAINFNENTKKAIQRIIDEVKKHSIQGRFVKDQHLHLTLEFLGDIPLTEVGKIKKVMDQVIAEKFTMKLNEIGFFKGRDGQIYWVGIEKNRFLLSLQRQIHEALKSQSFVLENRTYKPHVTIGRRVKIRETYVPQKILDDIKHIRVDVDKIDLMKSEHVNGELVYSIQHTRRL